MQKQHRVSAPGWYAEEEPTKDAPTEMTVEIDGEQVTVTAEDVVNLKAQQASATQKTQTVAAIQQAADKFGLSPEEYVAQADGAFGVMGDLISQKVIDNSGKLIEKKEPEIKPDDKLLFQQAAVPSKLEERMENIEKIIGSIPGEIEGIKQDQTYIIRGDLQRQIQVKHPELNNDDISQIFGIAMNDAKKGDIWQHAEDFVGKKTAMKADDRTKFAEEFGINLEQHDENKLRQASPDGGAALVIKGKKLTFSRTKDKDSLTPMQAMKEFMTRKRTL